MAEYLVPIAISSQLDVTGEERVHAANFVTVTRGIFIDVVGDLPNNILGASGTYSYTPVGGVAPYVISISSGSLPDGASMTPDGEVTFNYTTTGEWTWTVLITDAEGNTDEITDSAYVMAITGDVPDTEVPDVGVVPISYQYLSEHAVGPVVFTITDGALPSALSMDSAGLVTGDLAAEDVGSYWWEVTGTDANGIAYSIIDSLEIAIVIVPYELDPIGWWPLNDRGAGLVAHDISGNDNHFTYQAGAAAAGPISSHSTGSTNSSLGNINRAYTPFLNVAGATGWAIAITQRLDDVDAGGIGGGGAQDIIANYGSAALGYFHYGLTVSPGNSLLGIFTKPDTLAQYAQLTPAVEGVVYRTVVNYVADGLGGAELQLWLNNVLIDTESGPATGAWAAGADGIAFGRGFDGAVSDAMVFTHSLTPEEIELDANYFGLNDA